MNRKFLYGPLFIAIFLLLGGVFMFLWNAIVPQVTHLGIITYPKSLGLLLLGRILFGGFGWGWPFDKRGEGDLLKNKLSGMSDKDKAAFKEEWRKRCEKR